jgi:hypothetical protein
MSHSENSARDRRADMMSEFERVYAATLLAGVGVCERVSEVVDAVDASVQRAELN